VSSGTVRFALKSAVTTVASPDDSQRLCPVFVSQSCSHNRKVVIRFLTTLRPMASNRSINFLVELGETWQQNVPGAKRHPNPS
jgi:hypothetical protein